MTADDRCGYRATDSQTTRTPRDDGYRCGYGAGHTGDHELYTSDGESVLFAGRWEAPEPEKDPFATAARAEAERAWYHDDLVAGDDPVADLGAHMAEWTQHHLAQQEVTEGEVEAGKKALERLGLTAFDGHLPGLSEHASRAVLTAAKRVRA